MLCRVGFLVRACTGLCLFMLVACSHTPRIPATTIHENVHSGGSLVRFNDTQTLLLSAGWEGRVFLWQLPKGERFTSWQVHEGSINGALFLGEGQDQVLTAGYDGRLVRWSLDGTRLLERQTGSPIMAMAAHESANLLVTGHEDGQVRRWWLDTLKVKDTIHLHGHAVKAMALNRVDGRLAVADENARVMLIDEDGSWRDLPPGPTRTWTLDFSPDGQTLMGAGWFRLHRWSLAEGTLQTLRTEHLGIIKSLHYNATGEYLVSISRQTDSAVNFLDPQTGATLQRFQKHALCGGDVRLSPAGDFLASTADDASVRIWDLRQVAPASFD